MYGAQNRLLRRHWNVFDCFCYNKTTSIFPLSRWLCNGQSYRKKRDYYELLGVGRNATQDEIKAAFYAKSKKLHPDKDRSAEATKAFVELKEAYDVLRRPADRRIYDIQGYEPDRHKYRHPYYPFSYRQQQQRSKEWSRKWEDNPGTSGNFGDSDFRRRSKEQWNFILKVTAIGLFVAMLYNLGYVLQLRARERKLSQLVDEDEIAKSFMRQPEIRDQQLDKLEMQEIARVLKGDVDEAWRRKYEGFAGRNPDEIREEYRWLRAVQDADHTRRIKLERAERKRKQRLAARNE